MRNNPLSATQVNEPFQHLLTIGSLAAAKLNRLNQPISSMPKNRLMMLRPREPNFFFSSFGHDALLHIEKIVSSNFLCAFFGGQTHGQVVLETNRLYFVTAYSTT